MSDDKGTRNESEAKDNTLPSSSVGDYSPERDSNNSEQHTAYKKHPPDESRQWWERFPWQGFLSVIIIVIYGFQAYFMQEQLNVMSAQLWEMRSSSADTKTVAKAAKESAEIAGKQLEISERPWIAVTVPSSRPITFPHVGTNIIVKVISKNVGHSVAMDVHVDAEIDLFAPDDIDKPGPRRDKLCEKSRRSAPYVPVDMVFPGHDLESEHGISLPPEYIKEKVFPAGKSSARFINPVVMGCVSYRSTFSATRHVTGFVYQISSLGYGYLRIDKPVLSKNIKFTPYFFAGGYAD